MMTIDSCLLRMIWLGYVVIIWMIFFSSQQTLRTHIDRSWTGDDGDMKPTHDGTRYYNNFRDSMMLIVGVLCLFSFLD